MAAKNQYEVRQHSRQLKLKYSYKKVRKVYENMDIESIYDIPLKI